MYHKIRYGEKTQDVKKSKPKGGWEEDDKETSIKPSGSNSSNTNYQRPSFGKQEANAEKPNANFNSNYSYKVPAKEIQAKATISLEQRLIEDLLQPTGITIRPNENQLKEFAKRVKNLDKEIIFEMLYEKLSNFENMNDVNQSKILMKCLHILEYIAHNKVEPLNQAFAERQEIIENIKDYYASNKKLVEIANSLLNLYNPNQNKSHNQINSFNLINEEPTVKKFDLLNLNSEKNDFNLLPNQESKPNNLNLLDNIFDGRNSKIQEDKSIASPSENQKSFKFLKKTNKPDVDSSQNIFSALGIENNNTNSFGSSGFNKVEESAAPKKNFAFIKSKEKDTSNVDSLNNILNFQETESKASTKQSYQAPNFDIFDSLPTTVNGASHQETFNEKIINSLKETMPVIDMTKNFRQSNPMSTSSNIDDIFNTLNPQNTNLSANTYGNNSGKTFSTDNNNSKNFHLNSDDSFNYNHLGNHVEIYKDSTRDKDAFGFVSDMLKSKKN